jgi:hypothetical protein
MSCYSPEDLCSTELLSVDAVFDSQTVETKDQQDLDRGQNFETHLVEVDYTHHLVHTLEIFPAVRQHLYSH